MARRLYEQGEYEGLTKICSELIDSDNNAQEARTLWAKAYIQVMGPTTPEPSEGDKHLEKQYYRAVVDIAKKAETVEELFEIEYDFITTIKRRYVSYTKEFADMFLKNSDFYDWKCYIGSGSYFAELQKNTRDKISEFGLKRYDDNVDYLRGKKQPEYENYPKYNFDYYKYDPECTEIIFKCAGQLFEKAKSLYAQNDNCSEDVAQALIKELLNTTLISYLQYNHVYLEFPKGEKRLLVLLKEAEVWNWQLQTIIHYDNKSISLRVNNRETGIDQLKVIYNQISELAPDFVAPELPSAEVVSTTNAPAKTKKSSGGCYVATAVYGSYDCPQVWTLRRYRDFTLAKSWYGRAFIRTYYAISPTMVKWFGKTKCFNLIFKKRLDKMVNKLNDRGVENTPYND